MRFENKMQLEKMKRQQWVYQREWEREKAKMEDLKKIERQQRE